MSIQTDLQEIAKDIDFVYEAGINSLEPRVAILENSKADRQWIAEMWHANEKYEGSLPSYGMAGLEYSREPEQEGIYPEGLVVKIGVSNQPGYEDISNVKIDNGIRITSNNITLGDITDKAGNNSVEAPTCYYYGPSFESHVVTIGSMMNYVDKVMSEQEKPLDGITLEDIYVDDTSSMDMGKLTQLAWSGGPPTLGWGYPNNEGKITTLSYMAGPTHQANEECYVNVGYLNEQLKERDDIIADLTARIEALEGGAE